MMDEVEQFRVEYHEANSIWYEHHVSCQVCNGDAHACPIGYTLGGEADKRYNQYLDVAVQRQGK